jgi:hypothetical protein
MKALFILSAVFFSAQAFALEPVSPWTCPASIDGNVDAIGDQIDTYLAKNDLESAAELASDCATFGSGIDVSLLGPVMGAYSAALGKHLSSSETLVMDSFLQKCQLKGEQEGGSLGRSMAAHCQLKVYMGFYAGVKSWN